MEDSRKRTADALGILDSRLAGRPFICGDRFTLADMPVGIVTYRWNSFAIERPDLPNLAAWYARLTERAAFREHVMIPVT